MTIELSGNCLVCNTALEGPLSLVYRAAGIHRSQSNPNLCNRCNAHLEDGRIIEMTVLFADLSSFTEMTNVLGIETVYQIVDEYLKMASDILVRHDGFIDKYIGDEVMALFNAPIKRSDHSRQAVEAGLEIQAMMPGLAEKFGHDLKARVAVASGFARVGSLGSSSRANFTAIGDAVNLAARLESHAASGDILVHNRVYAQIAADYPYSPAESFELKGFDRPVLAHRMGPAAVQNYRRKAQVEHVEERRQQGVSIGSVLLAILGAPCAVGAVFSPLAVALSFGALSTSIVGDVLHTLDLDFVRLPLQLLALVGLAANGYVLIRGYIARRRAGVRALSMTSHERRRTALVLGMSALTLLVIGAEVYNHYFGMM